jgi:hypothetical protein
MNVESFILEANGRVPNNWVLPVLLYRGVIPVARTKWVTPVARIFFWSGPILPEEGLGSLLGGAYSREARNHCEASNPAYKSGDKRPDGRMAGLTISFGWGGGGGVRWWGVCV